MGAAQRSRLLWTDSYSELGVADVGVDDWPQRLPGGGCVAGQLRQDPAEPRAFIGRNSKDKIMKLSMGNLRFYKSGLLTKLIHVTIVVCYHSLVCMRLKVE